MKKKTFLVTGGTGFIGSNIAKLLVQKNLNVKIFDNNSRGSINKIKNWIPFHLDYIETLTNDEIIGMGHSIGGNIILRSALTHPEKFSKLILLDPTLCWDPLLRSFNQHNSLRIPLVPGYLATRRISL